STHSTRKGSKTRSPNSISRRQPEPGATIEFADGSSHVDLAYHDQQTTTAPSNTAAGLRTIGAAAVGRDHQAPHPGIELPTHLIEPASDGVDGELPGVVVDSEADIAEVGADVVDPVRDDLAQLLVLEIVSVDLDRFALRPIVATAVLEFAQQFLLLRVDRYHGFAGRLKRLDLRVDIFELGVAIRMFAGFLGLAVGMATIFQFLQQLGNGRGTHFVTHGAKRRRQLVVALGDPSQRPHRVAHRRRLEQSLQVLQQRRVLDRQPRCPRPCAAPLPSRSRGSASPSDRAQSCSGRPSSRARPPQSRRSPPPKAAPRPVTRTRIVCQNICFVNVTYRRRARAEVQAHVGRAGHLLSRKRHVEVERLALYGGRPPVALPVPVQEGWLRSAVSPDEQLHSDGRSHLDVWRRREARLQVLARLHVLRIERGTHEVVFETACGQVCRTDLPTHWLADELLKEGRRRHEHAWISLDTPQILVLRNVTFELETVAVRVQPEAQAVVGDRAEIAVPARVEATCALDCESLGDDLLEVFAEFKDLGLAEGRRDVPLEKRLQPSDVGGAARQQNDRDRLVPELRLGALYSV